MLKNGEKNNEKTMKNERKILGINQDRDESDSKKIPKTLRRLGNFLPEPPEKVYGASGESLRSVS